MKMLGIVDGLGIDLLVPDDHALPDCFISLLETQVEEFPVFNRPEAIVYFDFFTELPFKEWSLAFESHAQMLLLNLDVKLVCLCSFRNGDLDLYIEDSLGPVVLIS